MKDLARKVCGDLKETFRKCCSCFYTGTGSKLCVASGFSIVLPISFILQMIGLLVDQWASDNGDNGNYNCDECVTDNGSMNCNFICNTSIRCLNGAGTNGCSAVLVLEIGSCVLYGCLLLFATLICCRTCCSHFDLEACGFCYVCCLPVLCILPGMLSLIGCMVVSNMSNKLDYSFGFSFYGCLIAGCLTMPTSLASVCGYMYMQSRLLRQDNEAQSGSDDADGEGRSLLHPGR